MFPFIFDQHKHFSQVFKIHFLIKEVTRLDGGGEGVETTPLLG